MPIGELRSLVPVLAVAFLFKVENYVSADPHSAKKNIIKTCFGLRNGIV